MPITEEKARENNRLLKWFILPLFLINFIIMIVIPEYRTAGSIYFILAAYTIYFFSINRFQDDVIGIKKKVGKGILLGLLVAFGFILVNKAFPNFSIGFPSLPVSLLASVQYVIICGFAPPLEEGWRSSTIGALKDIYKVDDKTANRIQAPIFALLHFLAYGLILGAYDTWIALYGAFAAISGLFIAAGIIGWLLGALMIKYGTLPSIIAHWLINTFLFTASFVLFGVAATIPILWIVLFIVGAIFIGYYFAKKNLQKKEWIQ